MLKTITTDGIDNKGIFSLCLWNSTYLFSGGVDKTLNLFDLKQIKSYPAHSGSIMKIRKYKSKNEGESLITLGYDKKIYLWK